MKIARKALLAGASGTVAGAAFVRISRAAEFSLKLGTPTAAKGHPVTVRLEEAAEKIKQETGGRVEVAVFSNNILGSNLSMISQARIGAIDFLVMVDTVLTSLVPGVGVNAIPFVFATHKIALDAADGALGRYTRNAITRANLNLTPFERKWDAGFFMIGTNVRPVREPADLKSLKLRIQASPVPFDSFKFLGASPISLETNELYTGLQTHLADGGEFTLSGMDTLKLYEVLKFASLTNHFWLGYHLMYNNNSWLRIPRPLRAIVERNFDAYALLDRADVTRGDQTLRGVLERRGLVFNDVDVPAFRAALKGSGLYTKWREQFGAEGWAVLERTVGPLRD